jgi:hypothetical protein
MTPNCRVFTYNGDLNFSTNSLLDKKALRDAAVALLAALSEKIEKKVLQ